MHCLRLPLRNIGAQGIRHRLRIPPGLGRQHLDALRQEHCRFALHLGLVLQVFNQAHALGDLHFQAGQRFFAQRGARFGCVTLPGHGVGNIELCQFQQSAGLGSPLGGDSFLQFGAFDFVQALA